MKASADKKESLKQKDDSFNQNMGEKEIEMIRLRQDCCHLRQ
jgi:hypothetical protein